MEFDVLDPLGILDPYNKAADWLLSQRWFLPSYIVFFFLWLGFWMWMY